MALVLVFGGILALMLFVTTWAMLEEDVFTGGSHILAYRWGWATLADAYCGFLTFYVWVFWRETKWLSRVIWLLLIIFLGNIAMSVYVLWQIWRGQPLFPRASA